MTWTLRSGRVLEHQPEDLTIDWQYRLLRHGYDTFVFGSDEEERELTADERIEIAEAVAVAWMRWAKEGGK